MTHPAQPALLAAALLAIGLAAHAESKIPCSAVPAAVLAQAKTEGQGAIIRSCVKEKENGKLTYEVETLKGHKSRDMIFDPSGNLVEVEQEVTGESLPAAVSGAMAQAANGGKIGKIESVTRHGAIASYETTITRNGKRNEVAFSPEGTPVKPD